MSTSLPPALAASASSPRLIITYEEGLHYVQQHLNSLMHGDLKPWVEEQHLNYTMVVNLKNNRIARPMPRLVQKIMAVLGFDLQAKRVQKEEQFTVEFSLHDEQQIMLFRARILS